MEILLVLLISLVFFILLFIILFIIQSIKIRKLYTSSRNNVHFYVTCELNHRGEIIYTLWIGEPRRDTNKFYSSNKGCIVEREEFLYNFKW